MKQCPYCTKQRDDFATVCPHCGVNFANAAHNVYMRALAGDDNAQVFYGILCLDGNGVPKDEEEGKRWILKAAMNGNAFANTLVKFD